MPDDEVAAAVEAARVRLWCPYADGHLFTADCAEHGDPLAAIVEHLAAVVVLTEAAGAVEDMHIVEAMVFDALKWACRIAAKEAE